MQHLRGAWENARNFKFFTYVCTYMANGYTNIVEKRKNLTAKHFLNFLEIL